MMQGGDFHEALFLGDGAPPQFVRAAQRTLATILDVFPKRGTIFLFKSRRQLYLSFGSRLHARTPVSRTTKTSASSFPRPCCLRILSAARCGDSMAERLSTNSPRIPSVTKTSVSPFATGSTAACRAGNCEPTTPPRRSSTSCTLPFMGASAHQNSLNISNTEPSHHAMLRSQWKQGSVRHRASHGDPRGSALPEK